MLINLQVIESANIFFQDSLLKDFSSHKKEYYLMNIACDSPVNAFIKHKANVPPSSSVFSEDALLTSVSINKEKNM